MSDRDFKLIKLEKDNYVIWKWQFVNILKAKNLESVLSGESESNKIKSTQALALLGSALSDENILKIIDCEDFSSAWKSIQNCFENKTAYEPQALHQRLNSFKIESPSEISAGLSEMRGIVAQLRNLDEIVSDNALIGAILSSLPSSFDIFVTVWKNSADKNVDGLISKLMAEAQDQILKDKKDVQALAVKGNSKNQAARSKFDKNQCRYCKEMGHWVKDCPNLKTPYDPNRSKKRKQQKDFNYSKKEGEDKLAFVSTHKISNKYLDKEMWVADSGCTNHMSPFLELFNSIDNVRGSIQMADDSSALEVKGQGDIITVKGKLKNVLYVPNLGQNLFSISAAASNGLTHVGSKDQLKFFYNNKEVFSAILSNKLYLIKFDVKVDVSGKAKAATIDEWHARFNHVSPEVIKLMNKNNVVEGLNIVSKSNDRCEDCVLNKCTQAHHPTRSTVKSKTPGNVLHIDTSGPSNITSKGGSKYLVLCKDEASSYRQAAFVGSKDRIPVKVKEFISRAQLETGNPVLKLFTDNGSEFINKELTSFLQGRGIIQETSTPYVPAQNGIIERDIRTVKEAAKTMLNKSKIDKIYWPEAVNCAIYTLNRVINSNNQKMTPYEMWFGTRPNVRNLRIFGELAVLKKRAGQLENSWDQRGSKVVFLGYTDRWNTYRFLEDGKVIISCNATFINKMNTGEEIILRQIEQETDYWTGGMCNEGGDETQLVAQPQPSVSSNVNEDIHDLSNYEDISNVDETMEDIYHEHDEHQAQEHDEPANQEQERQSRQESSSNLPSQLTSSQVPVLVPSHQASERAAQRQAEVRQIEELFKRNPEVEFTTTDSNQVSHTYKLKHLAYRPTTHNWLNTKASKFISKQDINQLVKILVERSRTNNARALRVASSIIVPRTFQEAIESDEASEWKSAMNEEINSLIENEVYDEIPIDATTRKPVGSRWVFTVKEKADGKVDKFKARIVAKGYTQIYGIDFGETYCSVVHIMSTRLILSFAAMEKLKMRQFDIKTAFLYGTLNEEIVMIPPEGFGKDDTLWKLKRSLYGLKQSPRMWNERFSNFLSGLDLKTCKYDNSVFYRFQPLLIIIVYVDDGLIFAREESDIVQILEKLSQQFKMRKLDVNVYRGLEIVDQEDGIFIHQSKYTSKILELFNMSLSKPSQNPVALVPESSEPLDQNVPYRNAVGSLAFLADTTRPDIAFAVNQLARKMAAPTKSDWLKAKNIFRYLRGTLNLGIKYPKERCSQQLLIGFSDSDFAGHKESSKSTTGYVMLFNSAPFHWKSQLQRHVTLSSTEAEVIALCSLAKEIAWIRRMSIEMNLMSEQHVIIHCDNQSALKIVQSEKATARTRHLRAQDAYIREQVEHDELKIEHVSSTEQLADLLTKPVVTGKFIANRNKLLRMHAQHSSAMLLSLVVCMMVCSVSAIIVDHQINLKGENNIIKIYYSSPCNQLDRRLADARNRYSTDYMECKYGFKHGMFAKSECVAHYNNNWITALKDLSNCKKNLRNKRSIIGLVQNPTVISAATNILKSAFAKGDSEVPLKQITNDYKIETDFNLNVMRDVYINSKNTYRHQTEAQVSNKMPEYVWDIYHVHRNIAQKSALIRIITTECNTKGRLATSELAELMGSSELAEIDPDSTQLTNVVVNLDDQLVTLTYSYIEQIVITAAPITPKPTVKSTPTPLPTKTTNRPTISSTNQPDNLNPNLIQKDFSAIIVCTIVIILILFLFSISQFFLIRSQKKLLHPFTPTGNEIVIAPVES